MTTGRKSFALSRQKLEDTLVIWDSITTSDGAIGGTSLIDSGLIGFNDFITNKVVVLVLGGSATYDKKVATAFNPLTGQITFAAMTAQITAGTPYRLINFSSPEVTSGILADILLLMADVGDASASVLGSLYAILGNPAQNFNTMVGYQGATSLADKLTAVRAALIDQITAARMAELDAANLPADVDTLKTNTAITGVGRLQEAATTIDLNQAAATYDLWTGTTQVVILESLVIQMPNIVAGGALTSISIQTDDATPQPLITALQGAVANLTAEAQLTWQGICRIPVGTKIQLTIAGGAHGVAYVCNVNAQYNAVVSGGILA